MEVSELKNICDERGIKRIAMVDDVFDVPDKDNLDRGQYNSFRQAYNSDQKLRKAVAWVSGVNIEKLPRFEDLNEEMLDPLWVSVWKPRINGRRLRAKYSTILHNLFQEHGDDVLGMLEGVVKFLSLFRNCLEKSVTVYGTDFEANEVAKAQIVVIDYFLGQDLTMDECLKETSRVVESIVAAARLKSRPTPSFLLVSSRPQEIDIEKFRNRARLMKSRFRFFSKEALDVSCVKNVENIVNLHDLIDASDRTEKVERLIEDWCKGASEAINAVCEQMLELDVSDLVYLDCFRLTHEGTSIANYLRWFLTASLSARVTGKLTKNLWEEAATLKLFSVIDGGDHVDPSTLVKTFDGPSDAIAYAYGEILFDETRGTGNCVFPAELPGDDLVEGDLFVRPKGKNRRSYKNAEVRLVMTPSCDLISRADDENPSAKSVLLLPGTLNKISREDERNNFAKDYFVHVLENGEKHLVKIEWDFTRPISVDWPKMRDEGPGKGFKRLGRVRALYFHGLRDKFADHFTRIGTEVAPLFPHSRSGEVLMRVVNSKKKQFEPVMSFTSAERFLWEIGPILENSSRSKKVYVYQGSRKFVSELVDALDRLRIEKPELAESVERSFNRLREVETRIDIRRPMKPGLRGKGEVVEFLKPRKRSDPTSSLKSKGDLIIIPFAD